MNRTALKPHFIAIIIFLIGGLFAHGRVGETAEEITARYGAGKSANARLNGATTTKYVKDNFEVEVTILDGKSVWEIYHRRDKVISDADIKEVLKANSKPETNSWRMDKKDDRWERSGSPKLVAFKEPGHPDFFSIKDIAACEKAEKRKGGVPQGL